MGNLNLWKKNGSLVKYTAEPIGCEGKKACAGIGLPSGKGLRQGYALLEMVVLISIFGSLITLTAISLQRSIQVQKSALQAIRSQRAVQDFQFRLRYDLHRAPPESIQELPGSFLVIGDSKQNVIQYAHAEGIIIRQMISPDGRLLGRQTWKLSIQSVEVTTTRDHSVPLMCLKIVLLPGTNSGAPGRFSLICRLGIEANAW